MALNARISVACAECAQSLMRRPFRPKDGAKIVNFFCDNECKGAWQKRQHPVSDEWLRQKYLVEGLSAVDIAAMVSRDAKSVWTWLKHAGIETRPRGSDERQWIKPGSVSAWKGRIHSAESRRKISEATTGKPKIPKGEKHHWAGVTGADHPSWNGGSTPERQAFYSSDEWKIARKQAYANDGGACRRCGATRNLDIHHIFPFPIAHLRAKVWNLCVLCKTCHRFVHGLKNTEREFLPPLAIYRFRDGREINMSYRPKVSFQLPEWL